MSSDAAQQVHLFGVRHHGPGCARSLAAALQALQPDCILVEGPPEGDALVAHIGAPGLAPPVALLVYDPDAPERAAFYPFAEYSPEWQALRYANDHAVPARFFDLPQGQRLPDPAGDGQPDGEEMRTDPLRWLAEAAGFGDVDTWWDHLVEQRCDSLDLFAAIREMMTAVRAEFAASSNALELMREAHMRNAIRQALKQGHQRIAVVCGAWHVPALAVLPSAKSDSELLKGLPRTKMAATWVPWSYGRLAYASGYGAGVTAPGWYEHVWRRSERASLYWLSDVARLLRENDLDGSPAHVIEAVRLADALAALRERPRPGLAELLEAVRTVFCHDSDAPLRLIEKALLVNERLGQVPETVPALPLVKDVQAQQKRLRMPVRADGIDLDLDLREPTHLEKSLLLHRLAMLGIPWGSLRAARGKSGTFHELWRLAWEPEFAVRLIEASVWGGTLDSACTAYAIDCASKASTLPELTALMEKVLLADLRQAVGPAMQRVQDVSATTPDLGLLLAALPPLVNVLRYGSVRGTDTSSLAKVVDGLIARACIALPFGARGLADDAAGVLVRQLVAADQAIRLMENAQRLNEWFAAMQAAATSELSHPLVSGRCCRILFEQDRWDIEQASRQLSLRCSPAVAPLLTAHWLEGFLQGSGALLVHSDRLWELINAWLVSLPGDVFLELLPLLRRTFSTFSAPERRQLAERASAGGGAVAGLAQSTRAVDAERANRVLPVLRTILDAAPLEEAGHA
ncbi:DUF5682 family protein [Massilia terrae]|uniref:DUF5682 family protein n=1 Tax=Massilia terrae TaxID=1811224 RepID=A0ABT2D4Q0_9BURK|nr:DUF5682 family protein [Massilia terrae]MCS0661227.1 DUF5682 family protein [Massilia terrae]